MRLRFKNNDFNDLAPAKSIRLKKVADDMVKQNWYQFRDLFSHRVSAVPEESDSGPWVFSRQDIKRVVEKHICPEFDDPQIVGAVVECLYDHFRLT